MSTGSKTTFRAGGWEVSIEVMGGDSTRVHDYGLSPASWRRAAAFLRTYDADTALRLMDERAERAFDRDDVATCLRWRELMTGVHAIASVEPLSGDRVH